MYDPFQYQEKPWEYRNREIKGFDEHMYNSKYITIINRFCLKLVLLIYAKSLDFLSIWQIVLCNLYTF